MSNGSRATASIEPQVVEQVREFIVNNFLFGDGEKLADSTSFLKGKIIDSTGILELINFLEENFEIRIDDPELVPENLDSLENIARFVQTKTQKILL
ncbi:MAG: acyl carrier protein [Chitinivibrionales bacterium]|nr:acyl carrier protein [Chitinivibrionales bacterium]